MLGTLLKSLRGSDWEMLTDFVSPVFFEVVPTLQMAGVFGRIARDFASKDEFARAKAGLSELLNQPYLEGIKIADRIPAGAIDFKLMSENEKERHGGLILKLYFAQLFANSTTVLDIRSSGFDSNQTWAPKPVFYRWSPDFQQGIRELYRGFYGDDQHLFESGLHKLNLLHAAQIFRKHFGEGDQTAVRFNLTTFKESFHAIFLSCKEHRTKLHPDFFALGVYLVCLYEHLEKLQIPLNVRAAFTAVASK